MIEYQEFYNAIKVNFPNAVIELEDYMGDENHYDLKIVSSEFKGLSRIECHKLVQSKLSFLLKDKVHALRLKTEAVD